MRLIECESLIKEKVKANREDPEIYNLLQQMIITFLMRKKACNSYRDYDDLSYVIAGDLFLKIIAGNEINYYLGYLEKAYRKYVQEYYKEYHSGILSFEDAIDSEESVYGRRSSRDFAYARDRVYLEDCSLVINDVLDSSKYDPDHPAFNNLKMSLILSVLKGSEVYFRLEEDQKFYLKLLLICFYNKIIKDLTR